MMGQHTDRSYCTMFAHRWNPDWLATFTWLKCGIVASAYSFMTLFVRTRLDKRKIFSAENARSLASICLIHCQFLMGIVILLLILSAFYPHFPYWLTDTRYGRHGNSSLLEFFVILALCGALMYERTLIYIPAEDTAAEDEPQPAAN